MGNTGHSTGTHLHFEVHLGRKWNRVNPYPYIKNAKATSASTSKKPKFVVGKTYTLQENMNVRISYKTNAPLVGVKKWTKDAQKHATKSGLLKKGTKVTCKDSITYKGATWIKTPSGWICAVGSTGKVFIK